ncbi:DUF4352 domain-containing protein [Beduini massiliensis]|uniref:DUF4352 domain-containing protein n=1 Tax=Beduini massiliensis TaxID=1585974 RepID=UPI00059A823F|nr:DUF4352 domain-containing protein [Beduini massiliensis]
MKKLLKALTALAVCAVLMSGCSSSGDGKDKTPEKTEFAQSETATYKKVEYRVTGVEKTKGQQYFEAAEGKEYVIVHIKIENKTEDKISYNALYWKMQNSNGQEDGYKITALDNINALNSGDLLAGGTIEGDLVFEEPEGDTGLKLAYYPSIMDSKAAFTIKID